MKTFKQYLTESTKEHKFTVRFCCDLDEGEENRIETFLSKYDLKSMSKTSTTPITKNPMFFKTNKFLRGLNIDEDYEFYYHYIYCVYLNFNLTPVNQLLAVNHMKTFNFRFILRTVRYGISFIH